ncbi:motility associated factor glycosyltransferase family protein [Gallaecimonas xiamenensis]|uniref:Motility accesory factor maf-2 n=1 Tax=Gallaecimonas xiamenensis 3-C-1 TaxID=745411 RepID=K2JLY8_9GAMM|nr:6-hydroxymethylpterin diphosphokinase MptE-like protein [Gallaecimonas xiamenensis]EKE75437.1 motility accesory factor maf-2 [Gallaecimonas xiamenensis 3-C-1]
MSEFYAANVAALEKRWPQLLQRLTEVACQYPLGAVDIAEGLEGTLKIDGVQLTSRHGRQAEAQVIAGQIKPAQSALHLYGCGLGDVQLHLLARSQTQSLKVHILNEALFLLVLQVSDQTPWLRDSRVQLDIAANEGDIHGGFACYPSELVLASPNNVKIRERLVSELDSTFVNQKFIDELPAMLAVADSNGTRLADDANVASLFAPLSAGREIWVAATGPSLSFQLPRIKAAKAKPQAPLLIAVDTALKALLAAGIVPDLVVTQDHRISGDYFPKDRPASLKLVYFPLSNPTLLDAWQGPRYSAVGTSPMQLKVREHLGRDEGALHTAGSVIHPAVDLAVKMGAGKVVLFGADFAYIKNRTHSGWADGEIGPDHTQTQEWTLNGHGEKVATLRNFKSYLVELERYIAKHPQVQFFNTSREGSPIAGTSYAPEWLD